MLVYMEYFICFSGECFFMLYKKSTAQIKVTAFTISSDTSQRALFYENITTECF